MSTTDLARRLGSSQQTVSEIERSEEHESIKLETLRRVGNALGCDLVYFLVPRASIDDAVTRQARLVAIRHVESVSHHSRLEDQAVGDDDVAAQVDDLTEKLIDRRGLWRGGDS